MLATDDVRLAQRLYVETAERLRAAVGIQQRLLTGEYWYPLRLLCAHLHEAIDALATLTSTVSPKAIEQFLEGQADALEAFKNLRAVAGVDRETRKETALFKTRTRIGAHYENEAITRLLTRYADVPGYLDGTVVGSEVGGLARFIIADSLAVLMMIEAAGASLPTTMATETDLARFRAEVDAAVKSFAEELLPLAKNLTWFVGSLVLTLVQQRANPSIETVTIEIPPLLRAVADTERERRGG